MVLTACEDPIKLDLPDQTNLIVIEGWITNEDRPQTVKISRINGFSSQEPNPVISDARVTVIENSTEIAYTYIGNGIYSGPDGFNGREQRFYQLQVILSGGDTIISVPEILRTPVEIDSVGFDFFTENDPDNPGSRIDIYYPVIFATDPIQPENFYRWKIFNGDSLYNATEDIVLLSDQFFNGNTFRNDLIQFQFDMNDTIKAELLSLSKSAYKFFQLFRGQTTSLGTASGTSPASIQGNLTNISNDGQSVLGYFGATSLSRKETIIN